MHALLYIQMATDNNKLYHFCIQFQKRESQSKLILRELEESLERVTSHGHHTQPRSPLIDYQTLRVPPALPPRPVQHHPHTNNPLLTDDVITLSDIEESEVI